MIDSLFAAVRCTGIDRAENVSRNQIAAGGGGGGSREFASAATVTGVAVINGAVDLSISPDANAYLHGMVSETTNWVWQVNANTNDNLTGYVVADYQFNGLVAGDNKICSSPSSCLQVTNITVTNTQYRRAGNNANPNNPINRVRERINIEMDLSGARDSGVYAGNLQITLSVGPNANGTGSSDLACIIQ